MVAAPSLPAAVHYLQQGGVVRRWNGQFHPSPHGYAFYFTVLGGADLAMGRRVYEFSLPTAARFVMTRGYSLIRRAMLDLPGT